jgi:hypothetical protein
MRLRNIIILSVIALFMNESVFGQVTPSKTDSTKIYKDIESYSRKNKFTRFMYQFFFKPVTVSSAKKKVKKKGYRKLIQTSYGAFEGKIIRNINITTLDPFGYSVTDTSVSPKGTMVKHANQMHMKSREISIRNLLLIHRNQEFDSLLVKESERLVRTKGYIHDVSFFVVSTSKGSDSVDIYIREMDNWSLVPRFNASTSSMTFGLNDKNFAGMGHDSQNSFTWYHASHAYGYKVGYLIPNIRGTYINSKLLISRDQYNNTSRGFAIDRPFFSPFAKWAAGVAVNYQYHKYYIYTSDSLLAEERFKFNTQDYWVGNAIRISKGNTENDRTTNFISTLRFLRMRYINQPDEINVNQKMFSSENFYMASIGISTRKYVRDKYVFKYGLIEDVPIGKVFNLTGGYQNKNNANRLYLSARISFGNYFSWGYLSSSFEYGTFFRAKQVEQGLITADLIYFTGLKEIGKWKFREFIKPQIAIGLNRFSQDSITLNNGHGLDGFNSPQLSGTKRLLLTLQTQSYAPWNLWGFHFGPFLGLAMGILGDAGTGFKYNKVYSEISLGVLIRNDNLVISTFQFSVSYYPSIPGMGQNIFKANTLKTTDFGFRDFEIGKPGIMLFQ